MELDSKVQSKKDIIKEIKGFGICYRRNSN